MFLKIGNWLNHGYNMFYFFGVMAVIVVFATYYYSRKYHPDWLTGQYKYHPIKTVKASFKSLLFVAFCIIITLFIITIGSVLLK